MEDFGTVKNKATVEKAIRALSENGINAFFVQNEEEARNKILDLIPEGSEVMTMTSKTLEALDLVDVFNKSEKYKAVRSQLMSEDRDKREKKKLGAAPEYAIGSVHAVTEDGHVLVASNTGSQLAAYVYGADHVVWVVGAQKITKNFESALERIYEYTLPLESKRAQEAYGAPGSFVSKLLVVNKEVQKDRITMVIVDENLGF